MTSSSRFKRIKKIAERMFELESEVKEFHKYSGDIIKICSALVQKIKDVGDVEMFLEEYAAAYRYLSNCIASFSEFNCKMETLRLGYDSTPPYLQINVSSKDHTAKSAKDTKKLDFTPGKGDGTKNISSVNNTAFANGNHNGKTDNIPKSVKGLNSRGTNENSKKSGAAATTKTAEESFQHASTTELSNPRQTKQADKKCDTGNGLPSADYLNESAVPPTLPQPSPTATAAIPTTGVSVEVPRESPVPHSESSLQCAVSNSERNGERQGHPEDKTEKLKKENAEKPRKDIRELKIDREVGVVHDVILSCIVSPDEFYVSVKCDELTLFDEMMEKLSAIPFNPEASENTQNMKKLKMLSEKVLGSYGLGYYDSISSWARMKVLDWRMEEDDDLILIFYIDFGTSGLISLSNTLRMEEAIADYPVFVQKCYLSFIMPVGGEWSEEDKTVFEIFTESTEKKCEMKMEITEITGREDGAIGVKLFLPESKICINDKLIEYGMAVLKRSGDSEGRYLPAYDVGEMVPVKVTCIMRVDHIFCVKDYEKMKEADALQNLITYLNNQETEAEMTPLEKPPDVGELVIGKYEDGLWYRAQVVKSNPDSGMCRVIFLDYGNTETVSMREMRKMESKYLKIPFQMVECLLEDVELKSNADPHEAVKYLNDRIAEHTTIKIRKVLNGMRSLYSVSVYDKNGEDVVPKLISAGLAVACGNSC